MAELKLNETSLLGASKKSYGRSYGTTQRSVLETYIKHSVFPDDTLQGIALKYGVTVEQIKRANKLYTNDSIFLRSTLSIPVGDQPLPAHVLESATASANSPVHGALQGSIIPEDSSGDEEEQKQDDNHHDEQEDVGRDVTMDFFNRIDRQLRQEKTKMAQIETTSHIGDIERMSPNIVASRSPAKDPARRASTPAGTSRENSYQNSTVRVNVDRRRSADVVAMPNFSGKGVLRTPIWAE